jgi:hypothetical protein
VKACVPKKSRKSPVPATTNYTASSGMRFTGLSAWPKRMPAPKTARPASRIAMPGRKEYSTAKKIFFSLDEEEIGADQQNKEGVGIGVVD